MASVTAEDIKCELDTFNIAFNNDTVDKMLEQCLCHRLDGEEIVCEWFAFSNSRDLLPLTLDNLDQFEHEILNKKKKPKGSSKGIQFNKTRDINSIQDLIRAEEEEENLLDSYSTPAKGSQKRALTTPEHPQSKRGVARLASPSLLLSPSSFSSSATPSQKYGMRGGRGEVVSSFGTVQGPRWTGKGQSAVRVEMLEGGENSLISSYKYMFQRLRDVRDVSTEKIEELGEELRSHFNIEEFSPVSLPVQDSITVLGQVCCDSNGKLNAQSVLLEAGQEQGGRLVPVNLSELKEFSLFPGQVVVMEGMNPSGEKFVATKLYEGIPLPFYCPSEVKQEMDEVSDPVMVMMACGPYTPSESLTYDPLIDLITIINKDRPDVCILFGPFVDSKHEQIEKNQVTETFENIFKRCVDSIVEGTKGSGCRLVFVPSQRDVQHHYIYPQPPFNLTNLSKDDSARVTLAPDPCTLLIGNVTFGLTSTDILFHLGAEEISSGTGTDRFSRIMKHMLTQRSYYPLYPPVEEVNMDYDKFQQFGQMNLTPDILIVPSELRYFIKDVIGCVCVNPGRLTKGQVGGTYGRLLIQPNPVLVEGKRVSPCIAGQVVKI
ncbi:DNA polymerase alpha subunit B [Carassius auratus]|uniref:DNA polymerase alpha subunit B n=1 Tax=Carassius auratus TaxID=7957 RepID=A0A6P6PWB5_CARAU|nr:DNA polymerase alpha subunit B-like [Carassius auratus]XP_026125062.1 DNA polymerase alpha subunit B-like [Carassius auratus]